MIKNKSLHAVIEAFDSKLDIDWHEAQGGGVIGGFSVDDTDYVLQVTPGPSINNLKIFEISFHVHGISGDKGFAITGTSKSPTAVYGIVSNALIQELPKLKFDAVFFSSERRHSKDDAQHEAKLRIYKFAASRISKKLGLELYSNKNEFLLCSEYHGLEIGSFKHNNESLKEGLDPSKFNKLKR
jgi:hypothetical protein